MSSGAIKAALNIPSGYRDLRESEYPKIDDFAAVKTRVISFRSYEKIFLVKLFCLSWNFEIEAVYFHAKNWQKAQFSIGKELIIYGRTRQSQNHIQIIQPIAVKSFGGITPIYKSKKASAVFTLNALLEEKLPNKIAEILTDIHFPKESVPNPRSESVIYALKFAEIFYFLKNLSLKNVERKAIKSIGRSADNFINSLPFSLTKDQLKAIEECRNDLSQKSQSRRMIVGDVGCGKTMVIMAVAYMVGGDRSILMAPTSILARQIYEESIKFLSNTLKIALVTQTSRADETQIENADFIIGTHALLYKNLPRSACVMIDEQHRFGAAQRQLLSSLVSSGANRAHFFQFSATPIPRTLAMIQSRIIKITSIKSMPFEKQIETKIISRGDFQNLLTHIKSEIAAGNQIIIIYPLISASDKVEYQSIEEAKDYWLSRFDRVFITHGRDGEKEKTLLNFRENGDILLATTVVEVGISLPRLTTIVIVGAERLGMATLHQLRGRVGRRGQRSWCFLYSNRGENARLKQLAETNDGWKVAELDLLNRESGDLIDGEIQSGANFAYFDIARDREILEDAERHLETFAKNPRKQSSATDRR